MTGRFRVVGEAEAAPIADDETANAELNTLWKGARQAYSDLLAKLGMAANLRWLITGADRPQRGGLTRGEFSGMAKTAREIAAQATVLADHLDRAVGVYERRGR